MTARRDSQGISKYSRICTRTIIVLFIFVVCVVISDQTIAALSNSVQSNRRSQAYLQATQMVFTIVCILGIMYFRY